MKLRLASFALIAAAMAAGCAAPEPPVLEPLPRIAAIPLDSFPPSPGLEPQPPEPPLEQRWREPFAAAVSGGIPPRAPRRVVVLEARPEPPAGVSDPDSLRAAAPQAQDAVDAADAADSSSAAAAEEVPATYEIQPGDTWFGIARRFRVSVNALSAINPQVDTERIRAGQTIRLPVDTAAEEVSEEAAEEASAGIIYVVRAGDSLWSITQRHGVGVDALRRANDLAGDRIRVGQRLAIPASGEPDGG